MKNLSQPLFCEICFEYNIKKNYFKSFLELCFLLLRRCFILYTNCLKLVF